MTSFTAALLAGLGFCVVLGVGGGLLTRLSPWYFNLKKPGWKPPDWAFGPIWTIVFIFLTLAIAYAWDAADAGQRRWILIALAVNGVLNIAWSGIFFTLQKPRLAFYEVVLFWLSIVALIVVFAQSSLTAAVFLLPYLVWVGAASVLNYQIVRLNPA